MALTPKNWIINTYTNDIWTNLVAEPAQIATIIISNSATSAAFIEVKLDNGLGTELMKLLPRSAVDLNESYSFDMRSVNITGAQRIQVKANIQGVGFLASGVVNV